MNGEWCCYVCGKRVGEEFILWSMSRRIDRAFFCCNNDRCYHLIKGDDLIYLKVQVVQPQEERPSGAEAGK